MGQKKTNRNHIEISPKELEQKERYRFLISAIVPRPIALISSISKNGTPNLAPFSFFNAVSSNPMCLAVAIGNKANGQPKDTLKNILETNEFVVNSSNKWLLNELVHSAAGFPEEVNEISEVGLTATDSKIVGAPRIVEASVNFECKLYHKIQIGDGTQGSTTLILGEIVMIHADKEILDEKEKVNLDAYKAIGRLGGIDYSEVSKSFSKKVPQV